MVNLKDPPAEAIQTGYHLTQARKKLESALTDLNQALEYALATRTILVNNGEAFNMEGNAGLRQIGDAISGCFKAGEAHDTLRLFLLSKGYRPITNADFATYGSGGDR